MSILAALLLAGCGGRAAPSSTLPSARSARQGVEHAYGVLFDLANPALSPKLKEIQDGSSLRAALRAALASPLAKQAKGARVESVREQAGKACRSAVLPSPCATVGYELLGSSGAILLPGSKGYAVYEHSRWLVAKATICGLLSLENSGRPPAGC